MHELKQERSWLDIKKNLFIMKTALEGAAQEVVQSPSLEIFKMQLDKALSNLFCTCIEPTLSRRLDWRPPEVPIHLNDSMIL